MNTKIQIRHGLLLVFVAASTILSAQSGDAGGETAPDRLFSGISLQELSNRAGIIFTGTVAKIEESHVIYDGTDENSSYVRITFLVEDGIRNAKSGETITIQEWAGLWRSNAGPRYRIGEKLLMLYYPANASGATSPVGGTAGRFAIDARNQIHLTPARKQSLLRSPRLRGFELEPDSSNRNQVSSSTLSRALRLISQTQ